MPTDVAIGERTKVALRQIQDAIGKSDNPIVLPTHSRYGARMLQLLQLEALADYVVKNIPNQLSIPQRYLDAEQLAQSGATKAEIVAALLGDNS